MKCGSYTLALVGSRQESPVLKGKTVIPFNTKAGYGEGSSFQTVKELCPESKVLEGLVIRGEVERDGQYLVIKDERANQARSEVKNWLREIKMLRSEF